MFDDVLVKKMRLTQVWMIIQLQKTGKIELKLKSQKWTQFFWGKMFFFLFFFLYAINKYHKYYYY